MKSPLEMMFWSIAFPGFGQVLNGCIGKGLLFIFLEFLINSNANINEVIVLSFSGHIMEAIKVTNYQWIMYYPCVYTFAIWDAYKDASGGSTYSFFPAVFSAYFGTLGVVFSREFVFGWVLLGPIWLGILGMLIGLFVGYLIRIFLVSRGKLVTPAASNVCRSDKAKAATD
ncbi:MAG: hypothetical protein PHQ46_02995 [Negativicutes bacterium]|nr:hypothetical protein [Negativicutes bacterium]